MNTMVLVRVAKVVALLGFFMPWAVVSCSGQEVATMTGIDIALGRITANGETQNIGLGFFVIIAAAAAGVGLALSFGSSDEGSKRPAGGALACAVVALACTFFGMQWLKDSPRREADNEMRRQNSGAPASFERQLGAQTMGLIRFEEQTGYYVTLLGLVGAAAFSGMALSGQSLPLPAEIAGGESIFRRREDDVSDWDRIANKDDPDQLQEYLLRHPNGRFAELARMKLERLGIKPLAAPPPRPEAPPVPPPQPAAAAPPPRAEPRYDAPPSFSPVEDEPTRKGPPIALIVVAVLIIAGAAAGGGYMWWRHEQAGAAAEAIALAWQQTPHNDPAALRAFLAGDPGDFRDEAEAALASLDAERYTAARGVDTPEAYEEYLAAFPDSSRAVEVRERIAELQRIAAERAAFASAPVPTGLWRGNMDQSGRRYDLTAAFFVDPEGRLAAHIAYVDLDCSGVWMGEINSAATPAPWRLRETIERNYARCTRYGFVELTPTPGGGLRMDYRSSESGPITVTGIMTQQ